MRLYGGIAEDLETSQTVGIESVYNGHISSKFLCHCMIRQPHDSITRPSTEQIKCWQAEKR